ncbi:hypothetical protein RIVM261_025590 [Rivularia sp. IAM M-261]|nr:hypothetical protein CAL7716_020960 [Calothrix sp. PCC 7716]GJD17603.1 hypothetical protein RIVM261_025590 [Rivularia sp. IAM M-261]
MKKSIVITGIAFFIAGTGMKPLIIANAKTPAVKPTINTQQTNTPVNTPKITPTAKAKVELMDAGAEPRQELRIKPVVGTRELADMKVNVDMVISFEGKPSPAIKMPATIMKTDVVVTKVEPNGDVHYEFSYKDVDIQGDTSLPPAAISKMRGEIKKLTGMKGTAVVDSRGQTKQANLTVPQGIDNSLKQHIDQFSNSMQQLSTPFPLEAVGVGAKWRATESVNVSGMTVNQSALYELVSIKDNLATFNVTIEQQVPGQQKLNLPQAPAGVTMTVKSYDSKGQGQAQINMNKVMPVSSKVSMTANSLWGMTPANSKKEITMNQQMSIQMTIDSK